MQPKGAICRVLLGPPWLAPLEWANHARSRQPISQVGAAFLSKIGCNLLKLHCVQCVYLCACQRAALS